MGNTLETVVSLTGAEEAIAQADALETKLQKTEQQINAVEQKLARPVKIEVPTITYPKLEDRIMSASERITDQKARDALDKALQDKTDALRQAAIKTRQLNKPLDELKARLQRAFERDVEQERLFNLRPETRQGQLSPRTLERRANESSRTPSFRGYGTVINAVDPTGLANERTIAASLAAVKSLGLGTIGASLIGVLAPLAAAGALVVKYSKEAKEEAELRFKAEERIQGAINKQILLGKENLKVLSDARKEIEKRSEIERFIGNASLEGLKQHRDTLESLLKLNPSGERAEEYTAQILDIEQKIRNLTNAERDRNEVAFDQRWETWKKNQEDQVRFAEQQTEKLKQQATEMAGLRDEAVSFILEVEGKDNALAKLMRDFETATERAEKRFIAFGKEYAKQFAEIEKKSITEAINRELFAAEQKALQLGQEIRRLQDFDPNAPTRERLETNLDRDIARFESTSNSTNPDVFNRFEERRRQVENFDRIQEQRRLDDQRREIEEQIRQIQLSKITTAERNNAIAEATARLSPEELGDSLRDTRIAALRGQQQDINAERVKAAQLNDKLSAFVDKMNQIFDKNGLKVDLGDQVVIDMSVESKNLTVQEKRKDKQETAPKQTDVAATYAQYQAQL